MSANLRSPKINLSKEEVLEEAYRVLNTSIESDFLYSKDRNLIVGLLNGEVVPYGIRSSRIYSISYECACEGIFEALVETATYCDFCREEITHLDSIKKSNNRGFSENFAVSALWDMTRRNMEIYFPVFMLPNIDSIDIRETASSDSIRGSSIIGTATLALSHPSSLGKALIDDGIGRNIYAALLDKKTREIKLVSSYMDFKQRSKRAIRPNIRRDGIIDFQCKINTDCSHLTVQIKQNHITKEDRHIKAAKKALISEVMSLSVLSAVFHIAGSEEVKRLPKDEANVCSTYSGDSSKISLEDSSEYSSKHAKAAAEKLTLEYKKHIKRQVEAMNNMELFSDSYILDFIFRKRMVFRLKNLFNSSNVFGVPDIFWENTPKRKLYKHLKNIKHVSNLSDDVEKYILNIVNTTIKEERENRTLIKTV